MIIYAVCGAEEGYEIQISSVPCTTLDAVCVDYGVGTVRFLKIDVEEAEKAALKGGVPFGKPS